MPSGISGPGVWGWGPSRAYAVQAYNITLLRRALELMVEAAPACDTDAFRYVRPCPLSRSLRQRKYSLVPKSASLPTVAGTI